MSTYRSQRPEPAPHGPDVPPSRDFAFVRLSPPHGLPAFQTYDFVVLNLAGLCEEVPYEHELPWASDRTFLPKRGRQLPGDGYRWHSGEGRAGVAVMLTRRDEALAVDHQPDIGVFVGDGQYGQSSKLNGPTTPNSRSQHRSRGRLRRRTEPGLLNSYLLLAGTGLCQLAKNMKSGQ